MGYGELVRQLRDKHRAYVMTYNPNAGQIFADAADAIESLDDICQHFSEERRWVPVKERLPENGGYYTVCCTDGRRNMVRCMKYQKVARSWFLTGKQAYWRVTHWMPLPKPPEGV